MTEYIILNFIYTLLRHFVTPPLALEEELYKNSPSKQLGALQSKATKVPCLRRGI